QPGAYGRRLAMARVFASVVPGIGRGAQPPQSLVAGMGKALVPNRGPAYDELVSTPESAPLTLRRLEDHLWQAADLFRNKVSNQKDYILALLFFKRASDLYKEELEAALAELGDGDGA